ncbi:MAG: hypothetical protein GY944_25795 [bacterium]|nr:hypothetical protein [bacterium]
MTTRERSTLQWKTMNIPLAFWPVIAAFLVQVDVVGNHFIFDDYLHLYKMSNGPFHHTVLASHGGHLLQSLNGVVWFVQHTVGANASVYFLIALGVHLVSVRLIFEIVSRLTAKPALAALGAAWWGMCPYAEGSIGWMSVNGHVYLTAAILFVVLDLVKASERPEHLTRLVLARDCALLLVAATSFGTGLAAALGFGVVVALWDPVPAQRARVIGVYGSVALATVALYFATITLHGDPGGGQGVVDVVLRNLGNWPTSVSLFFELLAVGAGGLVLGPIAIGDVAVVAKPDLLRVVSFAALAFSGLLMAGLALAQPRSRRVMIGLAVLATIGYAMIAFARYWAVEGASQLIRYHYLPPAIMTLLGCLALSALADRSPWRAQDGRRLFALWLAVAFIPAALAVNKNGELMRIEQAIQFEQLRAEIGRALDRETDGFEVFIPNRPYFVRFFGGTPADFPGLAAFFVMTYRENIVDGRRVYFLAESREMESMAKAQAGSRIAELLVYRPELQRPRAAPSRER